MKKYVITKTTAMSGYHLKEGREVWACPTSKGSGRLLLSNSKSRQDGFDTVNEEFFLTFAKPVGFESEAQRRANLKYRKANTTPLSITLNNGTDADIIAHLASEGVLDEGKAAYVRRLIREDMKRKGGA